MISLHSAHPSPAVAAQRAPAMARERVAPAQAPSAAASDPAEQRHLRELAARDVQVRTHERAHLAAAGGLAIGGARFQMTRGPDGRQYATGGEVRIDVSPVPGDPQATIDKAEKIRRAALAPAEPSQADRNVAARATAMANEARIELQREAREGAAEADADAGVCAKCGARHATDDTKVAANAAQAYIAPGERSPATVDTAI